MSSLVTGQIAAGPPTQLWIKLVEGAGGGAALVGEALLYVGHQTGQLAPEYHNVKHLPNWEFSISDTAVDIIKLSQEKLALSFTGRTLSTRVRYIKC